MSRSRGMFVAVVGPSGDGKDSVISHARSMLAGERSIRFLRRVVTRPSDPGLEDHGTLDESGFAAAEATGAFAVSWRSHGLGYGLPAAMEDDLAAGRIVVANVSRAVLSDIARRHEMLVAEITATPDIIAKRLAARGRESAESVGRRMKRTVQFDRDAFHVVTIDNSGELAEAGAAFARLLRTLSVENPVEAAG